ncbi:MAG: hypothetical protein KGQ59_03800 [Bdellovibrionales bacterium]|nr:hypothetical protein [Bdellovibrionales bacterium]
MSLDTRPLYRSNQGSLVLGVSILAAVASVVLWIYTTASSSTRRVTVAEEERFHLSLLTKNILEFGKYLMLYEKAFYLDRPQLQDALIYSLWADGMTGAITHQSCGGYDLDGDYEGVHTVGGRKVFCPYILRFATMPSRELEERFLNRFATPPAGAEQVLDVVRAGVYRLDLDLTNQLTLQTGDFFDFFSGWTSAGSSLVDQAYRNSIGLTAKLTVEIYTDSSGFIPSASERFLKLQAVVRATKGGVESRDEETLIVHLTTPKAFALFMPYGHKSNNDPTGLFFGDSAADTAIQLDSTARIEGRSYFNGHIQKADLRQLPVFEDSVVLSGSVSQGVGAASVVPTADDIALLRQKFKKGFVTHFSAPRFLLDQDARPATPTTPAVRKIVNNSQLLETYSAASPRMNGYLLAKQLATEWDVCINNASAIEFFSANDPINPGLGARCAGGAGIGQYPQVARDEVKTGGFRNTVIIRSIGHEKIHSPITEVQIPDNSKNLTIMGSIMTGRVMAPKAEGLVLKSTSAVQLGAPGIAGTSDFSQFNLEVMSGGAGISVPLYHLPVVYSSRDSSR